MSEDSLQNSVCVLLADITSADEALHNLGTFYFVAAPLFSTGGRHVTSVPEILHFFDSMEELQIKVQEMITPPQFSTTLIFDTLHWWRLHLNSYVASSSYKDLVYTGATVYLYIETTLLEMEGGLYVGPTLLGALE